MREALITLFSATVGTLGFSLLFGMRPKRLPWTILGGALVCLVYLLTKPLGNFLCNAVSSFVLMLYCEWIARLQKAPAVCFFASAAVVLVPGGGLYYTISYLLQRDYTTAWNYGSSTLSICLGIAAGVLIASVGIHLLSLLQKRQMNQ